MAEPKFNDTENGGFSLNILVVQKINLFGVYGMEIEFNACFRKATALNDFLC